MITIVADFNVKPDCIEEFIRLTAVCTRNTRKENGNLSYKVFRARHEGNKFTFIEEWLNDTAIEKHNEMPHFKEFLKSIAPLIKSEPNIKQIMNVPEIRSI